MIKMSMNYTDIHLNKLMCFSTMLTISIILSYVESLLPIQLYGIGVKIGLANIVTIISIYLLSYHHSLLIGILRVAILSYIFANLIYCQLSLSGFLVSFVIMAVMLKVLNVNICYINILDKLKILIASIIGSIFHNIAQIIVCYYILGRQSIIFNLLFLLIPISCISGLIVGFLSIKLLKFVKYNK